MFPGFGSIQIDVSLAPDREMTLVSGIEFCHIRRFGEIKLSDPFLISGITVKDPGAGFPILGVKAFGRIADCHKILGRPFLDKNIIIEAIVPVENRHKTHHLCAVGNVIGRIAGTGAASHAGECAANQVMYHSNALGGKTKAHIGEKDVVIDEGRSMAHLHENILGHHAALQLFGESRALVVMKKVL